MKNHDMRQQLVQMGNGAHALAIQMLGNADDASDAVHDAIIKALKKPNAYDASTGPLTPWFLRVVRNHCIDLIKKVINLVHAGSDFYDRIKQSCGPDELFHNNSFGTL